MKDWKQCDTASSSIHKEYNLNKYYPIGLPPIFSKIYDHDEDDDDDDNDDDLALSLGWPTKLH